MSKTSGFQLNRLYRYTCWTSDRNTPFFFAPCPLPLVYASGGWWIGGAGEEERGERAERRQYAGERADGERDDARRRQAASRGRPAVDALRPQRGAERTPRRRRARRQDADGTQPPHRRTTTGRSATGDYWTTSSLQNSHTYYGNSITHSLFHSRLKSLLFCKSSLPQPFLLLFQDSLYGFPRLFTVTSEHIRLFTF